MKKFLTLVLSLSLSFNALANNALSTTTEPTDTSSTPQIVQVAHAPIDPSLAVPTEQVVEITAPTEAESSPPVEIVAAAPKPEPSPAELQCLQQNIYYEARGEGERGMQAVAEVTVNRANDPRYPGSVCGVVKQRAKGVCQFSWVCQRKNLSPPRREGDLAAWEAAGKIARMVFDGTLERIVGNATHFHTTGVRPSWSKRIERIIRVGAHIFYYERPRN